MNVTISVNNVPIRLTLERWLHITESHNDLAGYQHIILECVEKPDYIIEGDENTLTALKKMDTNKFY